MTTTTTTSMIFLYAKYSAMDLVDLFLTLLGSQIGLLADSRPHLWRPLRFEEDVHSCKGFIHWIIIIMGVLRLGQAFVRTVTRNYFPTTFKCQPRPWKRKTTVLYHTRTTVLCHLNSAPWNGLTFHIMQHEKLSFPLASASYSQTS